MTARSPERTLAALPPALRDAVLARLLARRLLAAGAAEPALTRADRMAPVPASLEQTAILKRQRRFGGRIAWTLAAPPIVLEDVDPEAVRRAVETLARRHDVLHMTLHEEGGRYVQRFDPLAPAPFKATKLPLTAALTGTEAWLRRHYETMLAEPFDPVSGPLWRIELISRGGRGVILLTLCSLIADGEALHLIEADLRALCEAERAGNEAPPPLALDYADYAAAQDAQWRAGRFDAPLAWWRERLAGGPPAGWPERRAGVGQARLYEQVLGPQTGRALDAYASAHRTTPPVVMLTEFMSLLRGLDGNDDLWVATATTARARPEVREMIGTFARLVPLRLAWPQAGNALEMVRKCLVEAMDQPQVPHLLLQEMLEADHPAAPSAFRYIFNHRHVGDGSQGGEDQDVPFRQGPRHAAAPREEDILMMVLQSGERRHLHWYLRDDRFGPAEAERLLGQFAAALRRRLGTAA